MGTIETKETKDTKSLMRSITLHHWCQSSIVIGAIDLRFPGLGYQQEPRMHDTNMPFVNGEYDI